MLGTGDSDKCMSIVKSLFDFRSCNSTQCSLDGVEQPPVTGDFMVTHIAWHSYRQGNAHKKKHLLIDLLCFYNSFPGLCRILLHCQGSGVGGHIRSWSIQHLSLEIVPIELDSGKTFKLACSHFIVIVHRSTKYMKSKYVSNLQN